MIFQIQIRKTQDKSDIGKRFGLHTNYVPVGHWVMGISCSQTQSHNRKKLMTTATKGEGEMTCPNTDGGAHGDRGHCVWQQMLCDSHQVISSTNFIIKIIIIWQQKQLAPKPTLSLISAMSSFHWSFLLYFSIFPHQTVKDLS